MSELEKLEKTKPIIRSVLLSAPEGVPLSRLGLDYREITSQSLPLFGYGSIAELCYALTDVIRVEKSGNSALLFAVSHESTKHVEQLLARQKKKKPTRKIPNGHHGSAHYNGFHRSRTSQNFRSRTATTPSYPQFAPRQFPQRKTNFAMPSQRLPPDSRRQNDTPPGFHRQASSSNQTQGRSVWERLGPAPVTNSPIQPPIQPTVQRTVSAPKATISDSARKVTISGGSVLPSPSPHNTTGAWSAPPNSPTWRHEYSEARTYPIPDLSTYAPPGELLFVIGYFLGLRKVEEKVLKSGRVLNLPTIVFPIFQSSNPSSNSVNCSFSFPNWAISTYNSPNQIQEDIWLKVYGSFEKSNGPQVAVCYLEVFHPDKQTGNLAGVETRMSSLSIGSNAPQPQNFKPKDRRYSSTLSFSSSEASDTSVYSDADDKTNEEDEARDQGYFSPNFNETIKCDFPSSHLLKHFVPPNEFLSHTKSISNLAHFYLILEDQSKNKVFENLIETLTTAHSSTKPGNFLIPGECKDLLCSAYNVTSSKWQRARFLNNYPEGSSTYAVSFIDLGEETQIPVGYIRPFLSKFLQLSAQALLCSLPLPDEMVSDPELIAVFRSLAVEAPLKTRVHKTSEHKFQVDLTTSKGKNLVSEIMSIVTDRKSSSSSIAYRKSSIELSSPIARPDHFKFNLNIPENDVFSPTESLHHNKLFLPPTIPSAITPCARPTFPNGFPDKMTASIANTQKVLNNKYPINPNPHLIQSNAYPKSPIAHQFASNGFSDNINVPINSHSTQAYGTSIPSIIPGALPNTYTNILGTFPNSYPIARPIAPTHSIPPNSVISPILGVPPMHSFIRYPTGPYQYPFPPHLQYPAISPYAYANSQDSSIPPVPLPEDLQKLIHYEALPKAEHFLARVVSIFNPERFYIQKQGRISELTKRKFSIQVYGRQEGERPASSPVFEYCLANSRFKKEWVRARVISWDRIKMDAYVFLLDYGTEETIPVSALLNLSSNHLELPFQAINVKLEGIAPFGAGWSDSTISRFKSLTIDKVLRIHPKIPPPSVSVIDTTINLSIQDILVSESLAKATKY